ncbi:hypothetical protein TWF718_005364 [Orbilia javanica]|uniref:Uncharacterized protein n=1 Tax=Orbilia javanica TaxID=47235 RepID=A0AAN8MPU1_9PEZI
MPYLLGILFDMNGNLLQEFPEIKPLGVQEKPKLEPKTQNTVTGDSVKATTHSEPKDSAVTSKSNVQKAPKDGKIEEPRNRQEIAVKGQDSDDCIITSSRLLKKKSLPGRNGNKKKSKAQKKETTPDSDDDTDASIDERIKELTNVAADEEFLGYCCEEYFKDLSVLFERVPINDKKVKDLKFLLCKGFLYFRIQDLKQYLVPELPRDDPDLLVMYSTLAFCLLRGKNEVKEVLGPNDEVGSDTSTSTLRRSPRLSTRYGSRS